MAAERAALALDALDRQAAIMTLQRVLDDREPEARAAARAAFGGRDAIEALGQPRDMLARDPGTPDADVLRLKDQLSAS